MALTTEKNTYSGNPEYLTVDQFKPDCTKCFGLCCTALYFSAQDGFPADKATGTPCPHLDTNFRCSIHEKLGALSLHGCQAYECFGAGQLVSQFTFKGRDWRSESSSAGLMFKIFLIMQQVQEMRWHLTSALSFELEPPVHKEIEEMLFATEQLVLLAPDELIAYNYSEHFSKINDLLKKVSCLVRSEKRRSKKINRIKSETRKDYFGKDLRKKDFRCADLRGVCLVAANLEGADLFGTDLTGADFRDANIRAADLSESLFLTQFQVNTAKGSLETKLPSTLSRPISWR